MPQTTLKPEISHVVDVDDVKTWPQRIVSFANEWAHKLQGGRHTVDLEIPLEEEDRFRYLFNGYLLRAIHCTRLFTHEREAIRKQGLRCAGPDLMAARINAAYAVGAITISQREHYLRENIFGSKPEPHWQCQANLRNQRVCLIVSKRVLDRHWRGVAPLLSNWGGEAIYFPINEEGRAQTSKTACPVLSLQRLMSLR